YRLRQRLLSICGAGLLDSSWTLTLLDLRCLLFQVSARASISFCFSAAVTFRLGTVPYAARRSLLQSVPVDVSADRVPIPPSPEHGRLRQVPLQQGPYRFLATSPCDTSVRR